MKRTAITLISTIISTPIIWWLLSEAVVLYEMHATGASSRAELANDFGLGLLLMFIVPAGTVIVAAIVAGMVWLMLGKGKSVSHASIA